MDPQAHGSVRVYVLGGGDEAVPVFLPSEVLHGHLDLSPWIAGFHALSQ